MNVLEEFWYGNIEPAEYDTSSSKEYKELFQRISRNEDKPVFSKIPNGHFFNPGRRSKVIQIKEYNKLDRWGRFRINKWNTSF